MPRCTDDGTELVEITDEEVVSNLGIPEGFKCYICPSCTRVRSIKPEVPE